MFIQSVYYRRYLIFFRGINHSSQLQKWLKTILKLKFIILNSMERIYPVFVLDESIIEEDLEYSKVIEWCYNNLTHSNILVLEQSDVYFLQYNSSILDIINKENDSMIQEGEDDWVILNEIKLRIKDKLSSHSKRNLSERERKIVVSIVRLLDISINTNKNLYFHF